MCHNTNYIENSVKCLSYLISFILKALFSKFSSPLEQSLKKWLLIKQSSKSILGIQSFVLKKAVTDSHWCGNTAYKEIIKLKNFLIGDTVSQMSKKVKLSTILPSHELGS